MCKSSWSSEPKPEPEPEPVTTLAPEPELAEGKKTIGVVFGTLGALGVVTIIIVLIVIWLRKRQGATKNTFKGFGFTKRFIPNRDNTVTRIEIDHNPAYTGMGARRSEYQYDINNSSRTNALDRNTYYSGYNCAGSVVPDQFDSDKYVNIPLK